MKKIQNGDAKKNLDKGIVDIQKGVRKGVRDIQNGARDIGNAVDKEVKKVQKKNKSHKLNHRLFEPPKYSIFKMWIR